MPRASHQNGARVRTRATVTRSMPHRRRAALKCARVARQWEERAPVPHGPDTRWWVDRRARHATVHDPDGRAVAPQKESGCKVIGADCDILHTRKHTRTLLHSSVVCLEGRRCVCGHGAGGRRVGLDEKGLLGHGEEWAADGCGVRCSEQCTSFAHTGFRVSCQRGCVMVFVFCSRGGG
jgi:hypothetical protein